MDEIKLMVQNKLFKDYNEILYILVFGCGGIMFLKHFNSLTEKKDVKLIQKLIDNDIIKMKQIGRNKIIVARHITYCFFGLKHKSPRLTSKHLLHTALLCEMLLRKYSKNTDKIVKILKQSNFQYYSVSNSLNFINRVYCFMNTKNADTSTLKIYLDELTEKTIYIENSTKGRKDKLEKSNIQTTDILSLRNNDIFFHYADYSENTLQIHIVMFLHHNRTNKVIDNIRKIIELVNNMMYGLNFKIFIDIHSLNDKSEYLQTKVKNNYPDENIMFHYYNVKNQLFSGIDISKWL